MKATILEIVAFLLRGMRSAKKYKDVVLSVSASTGFL